MFQHAERNTDARRQSASAESYGADWQPLGIETHGRIAGAHAALSTALAGCGGGGADLDAFIKQVKAAPGGRVEPLPVIQPYEAFTYADQNLRSPFVPSIAVGNGVRPDANRQREYLEQFSLDTLKMVGTLNLGGNHYGLVLAKDGRVHRVITG